MRISILICFVLVVFSCKKTEEAPFPIYMQKTPQECGPACLKMISDFYGADYTLETLALLSKMDTYRGTKLGDIATAARTIGLHNLAVQIDYKTLLEEVPYPAILHWDGNHFLVVYNMDKDSIWIADPAKGKVRYTKEEFLPHWIIKDSANTMEEGYALLLEVTDTFFDPKTKLKALIKSKLEKRKKEKIQHTTNED